MMWSAMINRAPMLRLARKLRRFAADRRGVSAVEFAMLLPLMVTLYLGGVEISQGIGADRKVTLTTRSVADLASRVTSINNADMTNILNAGAAVMAPYPNAKLKVTLSLVTIDSTGKATITWVDKYNGGTSPSRSAGDTVTLPTALKVNNTSLVWAEVAYDYKPAIGYVITGTLTLKDQIYMRPRLSESIQRTAS